MEDSFKNKYLKYKLKYINLKKNTIQSGGGNKHITYKFMRIILFKMVSKFILSFNGIILKVFNYM